MNIMPFDQFPGLTPEEVAEIRKARISPGGITLNRALTEWRPEDFPVLGEGFNKPTAEFLLGRRMAWDAFVRAYNLIGKVVEPPPPPPAPVPTYKKPQPKVTAHA